MTNKEKIAAILTITSMLSLVLFFIAAILFSIPETALVGGFLVVMTAIGIWGQYILDDSKAVSDWYNDLRIVKWEDEKIWKFWNFVLAIGEKNV